MVHRPDNIEEMLPLLEEMERAWHKEFDVLTTGIPFGAKRMTDKQHAEWMFDMIKRFPPEPWIAPDGREVTVSPWLLALNHVEDGQKELKRFVETMTEMSTGGLDGTG